MKYFESFHGEHIIATTEQCIRQTFSDLARLYRKSPNSSVDGCFPGRLIFPTDSKKNIRISEQEVRIQFIYRLQDMLWVNNWFYAIETPTKYRYRFSGSDGIGIPHRCIEGEKGKSASIDLTIHDNEHKPIAMIEFKAHNVSTFCFQKDFVKLNEEPIPYKFFVLILESAPEHVKKAITEKLKYKGKTTFFYCYNLADHEFIFEEYNRDVINLLSQQNAHS